ncbi:hypothetical protein ABZY81_41735 [Streptomyces sp. NPDC006514]|uniref:hypothetical protein n=1 Tax=Streptomyces sp. NPDC006514 TaxID=3154308 RepID=UPI0033A610B1
MIPQLSPVFPGFGPISVTGLLLGTFLRRILTGILAIALAMTGLVGIPTRAHAAIIAQSPVTWNMQHGTAEQWNNHVAALVRGGKFQGSEVGEHKIVALQEAGTLQNLQSLVRGVSATVGRTGSLHFVYNRNPNEPAEGVDYDWKEYEWVIPSPRRGSPGKRVYVYYLKADVSTSGQLGVAIISHIQATSVYVMDPQPNANGRWPQKVSQTGAKQRPRAALGILLPTGEIFWSAHMTVATDNNAVNVITEAARKSAGHEWAVLADFNRPPEGLGQSVANAHVYRPFEGTQQALTSRTKRELDYMVTNTALPGWTGVVISKRSRPNGADHWPVEFRFQASGEDPDEGGDPPIMSGADRSKCITSLPSGLVLRPCTYLPSQDWALVDGFLTNRKPGDPVGSFCLTEAWGEQKHEAHIIEDSCESWGDPARWTYNEKDATLVNGLGHCLDSRADVLTMSACDPDIPLTQQWYFPGSSAYTVYLNDAGKVVVNKVHQSGQLGKGDGSSGETLPGSFIEARPAYLPGGLTIVAVDSEGFKWNHKDSDTGVWSGWSTIVKTKTWFPEFTDLSVSVVDGEPFVAAIEPEGLFVFGSGLTSNPDEPGYSRIAGAFVPIGSERSALSYLAFFYNPGEKVIRCQEMFKGRLNFARGHSCRVVLPEAVESLAVSSVGTDLHLQYAATNGHVYAITLDIRGEEWKDLSSKEHQIVVSGAKVTDPSDIEVEATDLGEYNLTNLTSMETDEVIVLCGIRKTEGTPSCAEQRKFAGYPPQPWSKFLCFNKEDDEKLRREMMYFIYVGAKALCESPKTRSLSLLLP